MAVGWNERKGERRGDVIGKRGLSQDRSLALLPEKP